MRVGPFDGHHAIEMVKVLSDDSASPEAIDKILDLSGGTPFYIEELTKALGTRSLDDLPDELAAVVAASLSDLDIDLRDVLGRVAVAAGRFDTDQFVALAGTDEPAAFELLDRALSAEVLEHAAGGYQFRHGLMRETLLDEIPPHRHRLVHRDAAARFIAMGAPPARIAHHLIEAGDLPEAAPWALRAAQAAKAVGALTDARTSIEAVVDRADPEIRIQLMAVGADVLAAMGDPGAVAAYNEALEATDGPMKRLLRAKMARAAMMAGDMPSARAALEGLEPDGGPFDGPILHAQGMLAYLTGDIDAAGKFAEGAREYALGPDASASLLDAITLQGMVAHNKGEWFERMRSELTNTGDSTELAATVFDCHL